MNSDPLQLSSVAPYRVPFSAVAGSVAEQCLLLELRTFPKPGLVSQVDSGSHHDMDASTFERSADALRPFFAQLAQAGADDLPMFRLRQIGLAAETAMMKTTGGVNTHRGAIFGMGLLCAAWGYRNSGRAAADMTLGEVVRRRWGDSILQGPRPSQSHGECVGRRYGAGGARVEAAEGFPTVYAVGLPALQRARQYSEDPEAHRVQACMALIANLTDTNLLHRGGPAGLTFAQHAAARFLADGGIARSDWLARASELHATFVARNLSPGGAADLLATTLLIDAATKLHS